MSFKLFLVESIASQTADRMGLEYFGFGKYGSKGKVQYISKNGALIPFVSKHKEMDVVPTEKFLTPVSERVFNGNPVETKTPISKQTAGAIGEHIIVAFLKKNGVPDAHPMNSKAANFPVDMIGDHILVEAKTGLVSNSKPAQQWRATIGQPGKEETEWLKTISKEEKRAWNQKKADAIMDRKKAVLAEMREKYGQEIKPKTITTIINPDTKTADIYVFDGFHHRIDWNSQLAKESYKGTFRYE